MIKLKHTYHYDGMSWRVCKTSNNYIQVIVSNNPNSCNVVLNELPQLVRAHGLTELLMRQRRSGSMPFRREQDHEDRTMLDFVIKHIALIKDGYPSEVRSFTEQAHDLGATHFYSTDKQPHDYNCGSIYFLRKENDKFIKLSDYMPVQAQHLKAVRLPYREEEFRIPFETIDTNKIQPIEEYNEAEINKARPTYSELLAERFKNE